MTTPLTVLRNRPLEQWKVTELKDELKRRSITTKGVKDDLVRRLEEVFRNDGEKLRSKPLQIPPGKAVSPQSITRVQFHQDQIHFSAVHETQLAIYETAKLERLKQWVPHESLPAPISNATYSCDSQLIYASFVDGAVGVFHAETLKLRCRIAASAYLPHNVVSTVYPLVVAAHPSEPNQFSLGLSDGGVVVFEPVESEGKWGTGPPVENGAASSVTIVPKAGTPGSEQGPR